MRPLIFVLLAAISAQAQTVADAARAERLRRAQLAGSRVFTSQDVRGLSTPLSTIPATTTPPNPVPAVIEKSAEPAVVPIEPGLKDADNPELLKIRNRVRELQDRETALQLQMSDLNNRFFAPVTDQNSRAEAQAKITDTQKQLDDVRRELMDAVMKLQQLLEIR